jgi:hypothetical protein
MNFGADGAELMSPPLLAQLDRPMVIAARTRISSLSFIKRMIVVCLTKEN